MEQNTVVLSLERYKELERFEEAFKNGECYEASTTFGFTTYSFTSKQKAFEKYVGRFKELETERDKLSIQFVDAMKKLSEANEKLANKKTWYQKLFKL